MKRKTPAVESESPAAGKPARSAPKPAARPTAWLESLRWETAPAVLSIDEAARLLGIGDATLAEMVKVQETRIEHGNPPDRLIPVMYVGKRKLFEVELLRDWVRARTASGDRGVGP